MTNAKAKGEALDAHAETEAAPLDADAEEQARLAAGRIEGYRTQLADAQAHLEAANAKVEKMAQMLEDTKESTGMIETEIAALEAALARAEGA